MTLKKKYDNETKVAIGNDAVIELRNGHWQFRMWIAKENKMYRKSLRTKTREIAEVKACDLVVNAKDRINKGKSFYSLTVQEAITKYVTHRQSDIGKTIVEGRLKTLEVHLNNFKKFIGPNTRLKNLDIKSVWGYFDYRMKNNISKSTLGNEQSSINAMIKWLHEEKEIELAYFKFPKLKGLGDVDIEKIRRQTFTNEEWKRIVKVMREYVKKTKNLSHKSLLERQIARHWILIAANCGFRTGEQRQLKWSDLTIFKHDDKELVKVTVRKITSKVRIARTFIGRKGQYFKRLKELNPPKHKDDFVFFENAHKRNNKIIYKHFTKIMELAKIEDFDKRGIVPYSLRHFFITQRIKAGLTFNQVAEMCGTSVKQIEKTYFHADEQTQLTAAIKDYTINNNLIELENA